MSKSKKMLSLIIALVMIIGLAIPVSAEAQVKEVYIVHTNDIHGRVDDNLESEELGIARLKTFVDGLKAEGKEVLLLDGGDTFHGVPMVNLKDQRGALVAEVMNIAGYDAGVAGNHDFNYGSERLVELSKLVKFPLLAANVAKADGSSLLKEYTVIEKNGVKFGVFGLATVETQVKSHPDNTKGLTFKDDVEVAKKMVEVLKKEGAEVIIALTHLGIDEESTATSKRVAENVEGIDIIIDGHSHTTLEKGMVVNNTTIAQTGNYLKNIGMIKLTFADNKLEKAEPGLILFEKAKALSKSEDVEKIIAPVREKTTAFLSAEIGETKVDLDGVREHVRAGETNLGDLITDALKSAFDGADGAITNGGGIRATIAAGKIKAEDVFKAFPFNNTPVLLEVKGSAIKAALEHGTKAWPEAAGSFPHVSGITYTLDVNRKAGDRVTEITVAGAPLDLEKTYKIVTNDFMAAGGDGYAMFKTAKQEKQMIEMNELLVNFIKAKNGVVEYAGEKRIKTVAKAGEADYAKHWAKDDIVKVLEKKIFDEVEAGVFAPNKAATRAEIIVALARYEAVDLKAEKEVAFKDVVAKTELAAAVNWGVENKIIAGMSETEFAPESNITREQFSAIFDRYITFKNAELKADEKIEFKDAAKISAWAKENVEKLVAYGIIKGDTAGNFNPQNNVTRAESASMLMRLDKLIVK